MRIKSCEKLYHEAFENYDEFLRTIMERNPRALDEVMRSHDANWVGVSSAEEGKRLLMSGWEKPLELLKSSISKDLKALGERERRRMTPNVCGYIPIVPSALMRLPNAMLDMKTERVKSRVLRFLIMIDRACRNDVETIVKKMSKQLAYIYALERQGKYRCRIEVCFSAYSGKSCLYGSRIGTSMSVLVKSENQLFDVKRICYTVVNPSMLRLFGFAWNNCLPLDRSKYFDSSYGRSFEYWSSKDKEEFINFVTEGNQETIAFDLEADAEEILKERGVW